MSTSTGPNPGLTPESVSELLTAWSDGIVKIGAIYTDGGDYRSAARAHIERFYAYGEETVLFKPTLASVKQFRSTFDDAMSYFVGGHIEEDNGFAITPFTQVRWEPENTLISGDIGLAMGNYYFTKADGSVVKVEYTFGAKHMARGDLKFVLHHSSVPYTPS